MPIQLRHGARLVGRWETRDSRVVAVWEYDSMEAYEQIQQSVRDDSDSVAAQAHLRTVPPLYTEREEIFMTSTIKGICYESNDTMLQSDGF